MFVYACRYIGNYKISVDVVLYNIIMNNGVLDNVPEFKKTDITLYYS